MSGESLHTVPETTNDQRLAESNTIAILEELKVIQGPGHFVGQSGRHLDTYVNFKLLMTYPMAMRRIARYIACLCRHLDIEVVAGTVLGDLTLAHELAAILSNRTVNPVRCAFLEKDPNSPRGLSLRPDFRRIVYGHWVLAVADVTTSLDNGTLERSICELLNAGASVIDAATIWNRCGLTAAGLKLNGEFISLIRRKLSSWTRDECHASGPCSLGIPVNPDIGHPELA